MSTYSSWITFIITTLSQTQWGFQPGKSTVTALLSTTHGWLTTLEEGKEIGAVFLDLQKAFESVPHKSYSYCTSCLEQKSSQGFGVRHVNTFLICTATCCLELIFKECEFRLHILF